LQKNLGIQVDAQELKGGAEMLSLMEKGELELGFGSQSDAVWAFLGKEPLNTTFEGKVPARLIGNLTESSSSFTAAGDAGIKTIADLKGKRVMLGSAARPITYAIAEALLAAGGLTSEDVIVFPAVGRAERIDAIIEGRCDATIINPTDSEILKLHQSSRGCYPVPITPGKIDEIKKHAPRFHYATLPADTQPWMKTDTSVIAAYRGIFTRANVDEEVIYQVTKAIINNVDNIKPLHAVTNDFSLVQLVDDPNMPYHDGAIRAYKEAGLWTSELAAKQKDLLTKGP